MEYWTRGKLGRIKILAIEQQPIRRKILESIKIRHIRNNYNLDGGIQFGSNFLVNIRYFLHFLGRWCGIDVGFSCIFLFFAFLFVFCFCFCFFCCFFTGMEGLKPYLRNHVYFNCSHEFQTIVQLMKVLVT